MDSPTERAQEFRREFAKDFFEIGPEPNVVWVRVSMKSDDLQPTRHSLVQRIKNLEDQESWQDFFNTYWRLIYTVAARSGLNDAEAQDVVQDTVLTVVKNIQGFRPGAQHGSFRGWLLQTTRWRIADQQRKRSRAPEPLHAPDETSRTSTAQRVPDPASDDLDAYWESNWERNLMNAALEKVKALADAEDYQLFERHVLQGETAMAVARKFGVAFSRVYLVKYRLSRLLKKEVAQLKKKYG